MKWKTMKNAPKEETERRKLIDNEQRSRIYRQDCGRIYSRFLKVSLNITVL